VVIDLPLEAERLVLRDFVEDDWQAVHGYASDLVVVQHIPWGPNTEEETREFVRKAMASQAESPRTSFEFAVVLKAGARLIGGCGLRTKSAVHREGVIGYCFGHDVWGNGYAPEAARALLGFGFGQLELHRIFADCDVRNGASARVLEKIGMQREGRLREDMWYKGGWRDSYWYSILGQEW